VTVIYGEEKIQQVFSGPTTTAHDIVVYSPLNLRMPSHIRDSRKPLIGLCMAFEINDLKKPLDSSSEISMNVAVSKAINFDSRYIERRFDDLFNFNGLRSYVKYGTDINKFKHRPLIKASPPKLICNRGWNENHGNTILLDALTEIHAAGIDFLCKFTTPNKNRNEINHKYSQLLNSGKVKFFNKVDENEMYEELIGANFFVSASLSDGASVSLLEAMASGPVVIVSDFESNLEIVTDNLTGFTFKNGDYQSLAEIIRRTFSMDVKELNEISRRARTFVEKNGNWDLERERLGEMIENCKG
jgi:glycosyltransferase involved in cell wall biosynthesis